MYKLYYYPRNASWVPHVVLQELAEPFELLLVDRSASQQKSAEYLKLNPSGRIPTLIDGEKAIFESAAISLYLCEKNAKSTLVPATGHADRAEFYQWLFYLTGTLQAELMVYYYPEKHTTNESLRTDIKSTQESRITSFFAVLDKQLHGRNTLVGDHVTLCDYYLLMFSFWAEDFAKAPLSFEHLGRVLRDLARRSSIVAVCAVEGISLEAYR